MNIILLTDIDKVGNKLDVVTVKDGYGRNYLIPQKMAMVANAKNLAKINEIKEKEAAELAARFDEFKAMSDKIGAATVKIGAKAGTSGKIFGSVTNVQLAAALSEQVGVEVERRLIEVTEEVKELGEYTAKVNLHPEIDTTLKFEVIAE
ncbi:MAG: 50S ribosomal protein L9 [Bacteroidota bacterium]